MRVEFELAMLSVEVRTEGEFPDLLDEAQELFEVDVVALSCQRMAKVLANRLLALHQVPFVVTVDARELQGATERSD